MGVHPLAGSAAPFLRNMKKGELMKEKETVSVGRRDFFRKTGLGVGAVGAAVTGLAAGSVSAATETQDSKTSGYRETDHVKKFYELAKF